MIILIKVRNGINADNFGWISKPLQSAKFGQMLYEKYLLRRLFLTSL